MVVQCCNASELYMIFACDAFVFMRVSGYLIECKGMRIFVTPVGYAEISGESQLMRSFLEKRSSISRVIRVR